MTDRERTLLVAKFQVILQLALVEIRNLARRQASAQIHDLADTVEFIPHVVRCWDDAQADLVRPALVQYETKYPDAACRYLGILNMDEEAFHQLYRPGEHVWDAEPARGSV
jgi:hypothetical protein